MDGKIKNLLDKIKGMMMMSLYNDNKLQYDCWQERPPTISDSFKAIQITCSLTEQNTT